MTGRNRRNFSPEFRLEAAQLVIDQHYTVAAAATAMNVGKSTMDKWVRQLKEERAGKSPIVSPMTPEQIEILNCIMSIIQIKSLSHGEGLQGYTMSGRIWHLVLLAPKYVI